LSENIAAVVEGCVRTRLIPGSFLFLALSLALCLPKAAHSAPQGARANQPSGASPQQGPSSTGTPPGKNDPAPPKPASAVDANTPVPADKRNAEPSPPNSPGNTGAAAVAPSGSATLRVCIRTQDDFPFSGAATLHVVTRQGAEVAGKGSDSEEGETDYSGLSAGAYTIEATAPGFSAVKQSLEIESGKRTQTIFLVMTPEIHGSAPDRTVAKTAPEPTPPPAIGWEPPGVDSFKPEVAAGVSCSLPRVLAGVNERATQFVANLQKFSATEHIEHYQVDRTGKRLAPQTRNFDYVVSIATLQGGLFSLDEYRNGGLDRTRFPANVATEGLPAMALIFHPTLASDFKFDCEGLGSWHGRPAWLLHFVQRPDRVSRLGGYRTQDHFYPWEFKGRAWIDAGSYQILRLQMELAKPIPAVGLTEQLVIIDYASVAFHSRKQQLWLPQSAEMYMERRSQRFYRIHTFSDFKIYTVDTDQSIHAPKESYSFTNTSDHDIAGILTISPASGISLNAISIEFTVPPGKSVYKLVGPGKDINMPVSEVGSATFTHNGSADAIKANAYLVKESTLDVIADTPVAVKQ
jgi:hypothetical protein